MGEAAEKKVFEDKAKELKEKYEEELAAYNKNPAVQRLKKMQGAKAKPNPPVKAARVSKVAKASKRSAPKSKGKGRASVAKAKPKAKAAAKKDDSDEDVMGSDSSNSSSSDDSD